MLLSGRSAGSEPFAGSAETSLMIDRGQDKSREVRRSVEGGKDSRDNGLARCMAPPDEVRRTLSVWICGSFRTSHPKGRR